MKYHIIKESRLYTRIPYCGATSGGHPAEAETMEAAVNMARDFMKRNPVGWNVYDSDTGELIYGKEVVK